ncbi:hypothetical protein J6W34_01550 [bacterium]|nr:hypothetical protein [bacterium]MBO7043230.1 hypothetical protein [bacterium]
MQENAVTAVSHPYGSWFASASIAIAAIPHPAENAPAATEIAVEAIAHAVEVPKVHHAILYSTAAKIAAAAEIPASTAVAIFNPLISPPIVV